MAPRPRLPLPLLLTVVLGQLGALLCEGETRRLRGSVTCLDCAAGHDLSGVIVAVKCAAGNESTALHAAQTDARSTFDVAVPASSGSPCAARVLGAAQRLCAPQGLTVAPVVPERAPASSSYALGSRLAFFTRCEGPGGGGTAAAATTVAARDQGRHAWLRVPSPMPMTPVRSPPAAGGSGGAPYGMGGLPIIYFFPFVPIIGIP